MLLHFLLLIVGLVILYYGAEYLVQGASKIALAYGISPLIIGLTIVAFATSAPEFVVSLLATLNGSPDLAIGNVVGSNVANIALIIGASAVILPMGVERIALQRDYPFMMGATLIAVGAAYVGGTIGRGDGAILLGVLGFFLFLCLRVALRQNREFRMTGQMDAVAHNKRAMQLNVVKVIGGIIGLVVGAQLMVNNAVEIARFYEVSELVIGVSIVALGTSLPELATSVVAALKKEADMSLGNILGSNIFNIGFILGGVSMVKPIPVAPEALRFDLPAMVVVSLLLFPFMRLSYRVTRIDGALLLICYFTYLVLSYLFSVGTIG